MFSCVLQLDHQFLCSVEMCSGCIQRSDCCQFNLFFLIVIYFAIVVLINIVFKSLSSCQIVSNLLLFVYFSQIIQHVLLDVPSLAFFTTYALLVLFWAEIYYQVRYKLWVTLVCWFSRYLLVWFVLLLAGLIILSTWQARAVSTDGLRPSFYTINAVVYAIQVTLLENFKSQKRGDLDVVFHVHGSLTKFCNQCLFKIEKRYSVKRALSIIYLSALIFLFLFFCLFILSICYSCFDK